MLALESLELRTCPSAPVNPVASIFAVGVNGSDYVPMVQMMTGPLSALMTQAGWNVGQGALGGVVNVPSNNGTLTEAQLDQQIGQAIDAGQIPGGPSAVVMVFLDKPPANPMPNSAAWHDGFVWKGQEIVTCWTWRQPWESIAATHEWEEATARMAGAPIEVSDPVNWQAEPLAGFNVSNFVKPNGTPAFAPQKYIGGPWDLGPVSPPAPPAPPQQPESPTSQIDRTFTIALEQFDALAFRLLALIDPKDFSARADAAQAALAANPALSTPLGQQAQHAGAAAFLQWANGL